MFSVVGNVGFRPLRPTMLLFWLLAVCGWMVATGCSSVDPVVKIALIGPFEGKHRAIGYDAIYSARMAIREVNASGGVGRYRVGLVALDDFGDPESARVSAEAVASDPAVVAIIGHWLPETTAAAEAIYETADLPVISMGRDPFGVVEPSNLPADFLRSYAEVTPFDEVAGPNAGPTYDALQLILEAMKRSENDNGIIDRAALNRILQGLSIEGITGTVYQRDESTRKTSCLFPTSDII